MALQTSIKINGVIVPNAYIAVAKTRLQKVYERDESGNITNSFFVTWVNLGGAVNQEAWQKGDRFGLNHVVFLQGDILVGDIYTALKTIKIDMYELDLTQAIDV